MEQFTGKFRAHKNGPPSHDPPAGNGKVTKRPRESRVCNPCRKSKLRCDRAQPCGSCMRRDEAEACYYGPPAAKMDTTRHVAAEDRLLHLEATVRQLMQNQTFSQASALPGDNRSLSNPVGPRPTPGHALPGQPREPVLGVDQLRIEPVESIDDASYVGSTHWVRPYFTPACIESRAELLGFVFEAILKARSAPSLTRHPRTAHANMPTVGRPRRYPRVKRDLG
ncbi:hypothetical protein EG329_000571 [Mollisiaceae sp. DMI_Dod_QoI]|nr:hypothetical protein EG329_000571 [Helotiales sp. DMI_Dod_QoI]